MMIFIMYMIQSLFMFIVLLLQNKKSTTHAFFSREFLFYHHKTRSLKTMILLFNYYKHEMKRMESERVSKKQMQQPQ
jgi:hypothetical protein